MTLSEPATLLTDYLLAIFTGELARRLRRRSQAATETGRSKTGSWLGWWSAAFASAALAGVAGGTVHGFQHALDPAALDVLWIVALEGLVAAAYAVVRAAIGLAQPGQPRRGRAVWTAGLTFGGYGLWLVWSPVFLWALVAYGAAFAVLVLVLIRGWPLDASGRRLLGGVLVSLVAAGVQQSGWSLHRHFNHNDLYHVVQALAVWLLFQGAMRRDREAAGAALTRS